MHLIRIRKVKLWMAEHFQNQKTPSLQNQKKDQNWTQTFSNSGRWLWISVTGCLSPRTLKLSWLPLQASRHLSSHWLSRLGPGEKHKLNCSVSYRSKRVTLFGLEGSSLSSPRVDMRGTPCRDRNFLSMATILVEDVHYHIIRQKEWTIVTWDGCTVQHLGEECFPICLQRPSQPAS